MNFTGQVALITGAASGMGAATAREFAAAGGQVMIVDRNEELARQVAGDIGAGELIIGDVSDPAFCNRAVEITLAQHGRLDVLVNAAGVIVRASGEQTTDEQWQRIIGVNLNGVFFMC
ncbi:MAG: SDR family NAD(P)-dependent oxidoreductase, partial [Anaerolineae bacterium]|nr:SDR family NAD(P)-dependent oxidoreductase [Anaerolineae bacterium]